MNHEREAFNKKVAGMPKPGSESGDRGASGGSSKTTIEHRPDGTHSVQHADGETSDHPHIGAALMALHAKHGDGPAGIMSMNQDGGATTHYVDETGMVQGPGEQDSAESAGSHLASMMGGGEEMDEGRRMSHEAEQSELGGGPSVLY